MTRSNRRIKRNVSSTSEFYRLAVSRLRFFLRVSSRSLDYTSYRSTSMRGLRGSGSPRKREVPGGTVCFPAICRTVNSERVACMARALLQNGNGSWPNAEGGRRTSTESRVKAELWRNSGTGRAIQQKGYLTGGWKTSRGINRSPMDSSLRFLTYNRRRARDFWDTDRRAAFMHFTRHTRHKIHHSGWRKRLIQWLLVTCLYVSGWGILLKILFLSYRNLFRINI